MSRPKKRVRRIERDPAGGWIVRRKDGRAYYDENWRWNSRSVARTVVMELDWQEIERNG